MTNKIAFFHLKVTRGREFESRRLAQAKHPLAIVVALATEPLFSGRAPANVQPPISSKRWNAPCQRRNSWTSRSSGTRICTSGSPKSTRTPPRAIGPTLPSSSRTCGSSNAPDETWPPPISLCVKIIIRNTKVVAELYQVYTKWCQGRGGNNKRQSFIIPLSRKLKSGQIFHHRKYSSHLHPFLRGKFQIFKVIQAPICIPTVSIY